MLAGEAIRQVVHPGGVQMLDGRAQMLRSLAGFDARTARPVAFAAFAFTAFTFVALAVGSVSLGFGQFAHAITQTLDLLGQRARFIGLAIAQFAEAIL